MAIIEQDPTTQAIDIGWHDDPWGEHRLRYFDGVIWTDHVTHYGPTPCAGCNTVSVPSSLSSMA